MLHKGLFKQVLTRPRFLDLPNNMGHPGLVTQEGGKLARLVWIILRESLHWRSKKKID